MLKLDDGTITVSREVRLSIKSKVAKVRGEIDGSFIPVLLRLQRILRDMRYSADFKDTGKPVSDFSI